MSSTLPDQGAARVATCNYCSKVLGKQYYFTCHICGATYCYIHLAKHGKFHKAPLPLLRTS